MGLAITVYSAIFLAIGGFLFGMLQDVYNTYAKWLLN